MLNTLPLFFFFFWVRREEEHKLIALLFRSLENHKISIFILCCIWLLKKLEQPHQSVQNSCLFCKKKHIFFYFTFSLFYKTPTLVYLFYHLFYLNNNISLIFFIISNKPLPTWPNPPFSFFVVRRRQVREQPDGERENKNKKIIYT